MQHDGLMKTFNHLFAFTCVKYLHSHAHTTYMYMVCVAYYHIFEPKLIESHSVRLFGDVFHTDRFQKKSTPQGFLASLIEPKDGAEAAPWMDVKV